MVYSKRLLISHAGALASYEVPAGITTVITCLTAFNPNALLPRKAALVHDESAATIWQEGNLGGAGSGDGDSMTVMLRVVLQSGEHIHTNSDSDVDIIVSGYELTN